MTRTIIAIDGPAGSGKSSVSKLVASKLGLAYVDTGATYRVVALEAMRRGVSLDDPRALAVLSRETLQRCALGGAGLVCEGQPVGNEIRTPEVSEATSIIAAHPEMREVLVEFQRSLVPARGAVVEGRDIGAVVWPNADVKVYLDARPDVRAGRRANEQGTSEALAVEVFERDQRDASRAVSAMQAAPGAVRIDTSDMSAEEVAGRVLELLDVSKRRPGNPDLFYRSVRGVLKGLLYGPLRMEIAGKENVPSTGPAILAFNHRSLIDIPVASMVTRRKVWFMAKDELFASKLSARILGGLGGFPVRRGRPDRSALLRSLELLQSGEILGIFPEGTRTPGARFETLEEGFAYIALKSGAPIVPVAISGTEAVFPPGRKMPKFVKVRVLVGQPFTLGTPAAGVLPRGRIRDATTEASKRLQSVMNELEPQ